MNTAAVIIVSIAYVWFIVPAALSVLQYAFGSARRSLLVGVWTVLVGVALPCMRQLSSHNVVPHIVLRKGYHLLALALFIPALRWEPTLLQLAFAAAFALLAAAELLRVLDVPSISCRISVFMHSFTDARDSGAFLVSHFCLLLGIAGPILATTLASNDVIPAGSVSLVHANPPLACWSGLLSLGVADTIAAAVGTAVGRVRIHKSSRKTLEGTLAAAVCMYVCMLALQAFEIVGARSGELFDRIWDWEALCRLCRMAWYTLLTCWLEAVTDQLDNIVFPLHCMTLFALL